MNTDRRDPALPRILSLGRFDISIRYYIFSFEFQTLRAIAKNLQSFMYLSFS